LVPIGLRHRQPRDRMLIGSSLLALGSALTALALEHVRLPSSTRAIAISGLGFGVAFSGALQSLIALAADDARAELVATVYVVAYLSFSLPTVIAGFASAPLGLLTTGVIFSAVVAGLCLLSLLATWQRNPADETAPLSRSDGASRRRFQAFRKPLRSPFGLGRNIGKGCHEPCHELRNSEVISAHLRTPQTPAAAQDALQIRNL
jgi:MFS family permease